MTKTERRERLTLTLVISLFVFAALIIAMVIVGVVAVILLHVGVLHVSSETESLTIIVLSLIAASAVIGSVASWLTIRMPLGLVNRLVNGLDRLASGEFGARIYPEKKYEQKLYELRVMRVLTDSFNALASELENTELLRSDFINNFSHEFKTPIVSIAGFAKLLKRCNLPEEQRREYLDIIEEESLRLSAMATNVLNLTKVENQTILTDVTTYNLAEQLRTCVLLLEAKWERKRIEPELNLEELYIEGTEELLKQVWINLLDNAVKFSPEDSVIQMEARKTDSGVAVAIQNHGPAIPPEALGRIFTKFYQADGSHATEGNGVGLAIVKRVVDLHGGSVQVASAEGTTTFTVFLPQRKA